MYRMSMAVAGVILLGACASQPVADSKSCFHLNAQVEADIGYCQAAI
jgi:uncharacterized membrane protein